MHSDSINEDSADMGVLDMHSYIILPIKEDKKNPLEKHKQLFIDTQNNINYLKAGIINGIFNDTDAVIDVDTMTFKAKEKTVLKVHVNKDGTPKKINTCNSRGRYETRTVTNGERIEATDFYTLIDKLYEAYLYSLIEVTDFTFGGVWKKAFEVYKKGKVTEKTIRLVQANYNKYINDELAKKDIRKITADYLNEYASKLAKTCNFEKHRWGISSQITTENPLLKSLDSYVEKTKVSIPL